jgi:CRISPR-associated endonuclease Csn1
MAGLSKMHWRLGVDLGSNSLGWAAVELNKDGRPCRLIAAGSRIFGAEIGAGRDAKSGASLAVERRAARAMRRRRDRFKQRQAALLKHLTLAGLFPASDNERKALAGLDPFALRASGLHEALPLHHVGRALFHLNQRRGFKSNRKADRGKNEEDGKIRIGVSRLHEKMRDAGADTLGEFLHGRRAGTANPNAIPSVRTRLRPEAGEGATSDGYDFYPDRQMLEDEFAAIWAAQAPHHPDTLTPENEKRLFEVIFHQRKLKKPKIGKCTLLGSQERLPKAHPLFQQRRLLEELNALRIVRAGQIAAPLTLKQRDALYLSLKDKRAVTFERLRKVLKLDPDDRFNKESENRKDIKGDELAAELGAKGRFGNRWAHFGTDTQWDIISRIRDQESDEDEAKLLAWLQDVHGLTQDQARVTVGARLPEGYGRFGITATTELIEALRTEVIVYSEAVQKAGLGHHSDRRTGEIFTDEAGRPVLPYYGVALERHIMPGTGETSDPEEMRVGRLTNPTVHVGLNQLRKVVNALIRTYGPPQEIAVELARELKLDDDKKKEINTRNRRNREAAERRSRKLGEIGMADKGGNRAMLKLWEELNPQNVLDRRCVYTGKQISIDMLFSEAVEVDHILPFSATLDDSNGNKILCMREANREKRKRSPYEAFGHRGDWEDVAARAARLPREKRWRFEPDAMTRFDNQGGFLARQLIDTQHLSRLAREYLCALYPESGEGSSHVWVSPGRLTEMVRRKLGLNDLLPDHNFSGGGDQKKSRLDHRHHAIDAIVIAIVDRPMLQAIARASAAAGFEGQERIIIPEPWKDFRNEVRNVINAVVVSHRPDHGTAAKTTGSKKGPDATAGRLHNETAYGLTGEKDAKGNDIVVHRVPLAALKKPADIQDVRDPDLRAALLAWTMSFEGKDFEARLRKFPELGPEQFRNIRRLRVVEPLSVIPIRDKNGRAYKGYKGDSNYRYDVWELKDGKWVPEVVSMFDAHQLDWTSAIRRDNPTARKVLSLHQDDVLAIQPDGQDRRLMRVVKFGQNGQITLAEPQEAGDLKRRDATPNDLDPFKYTAPTAGGLKRIKARQVRIDELGRVFDPGPRGRPEARA